MNDILQYESYLPINAVVFYIGAYSPSDSQLEKIVRNVLRVKELILENREIAKSFSNFSDISVDKDELSVLINKRNRLFSGDRSYIMKNITMEFLNEKILKSGKNGKIKNIKEIIKNGESVKEIENIKESRKTKKNKEENNTEENFKKIENFKKKENHDNNHTNYKNSNRITNPIRFFITETESTVNKDIQDDSNENIEYNVVGGRNIVKISYINKNNIFDKENNKIEDLRRDEEYRKMIFRLKSVIEENKNISKQVQQEKEEFYRKFVKYSAGEILRTKIGISLGSYIISTSMLPTVIGNIDVVDKDVKIREWMYKIMKHVENMELNIGTKSAFEKKYIVKEFLEECIDRNNEDLDKLFELRSNILLTALKSKKALDKINIKQERHIKELIKIVENMKDEEWIIKYNKDIAEDFIKYLLTNQKRDKEALLRHFIN